MLPTLDESARQLSASGEYRVLRRVPPVERWELPEAVGGVGHAVFADTETTGTGDADEVIELGMLPIDYCKTTGRVVAVQYDRALSALRQPSIPIPAESQRIHGISDVMVAGQTIGSEQIAATIGSAPLVICHNAGFDRRMLERHWPEVFGPLCFACSCEDIAWRAEGFETAALKWLLVSHGYFHEGHRALDDALATAFLLTLPLPSGRPAMSVLLEQARKPMTMVQAVVKFVWYGVAHPRKVEVLGEPYKDGNRWRVSVRFMTGEEDHVLLSLCRVHKKRPSARRGRATLKTIVDCYNEGLPDDERIGPELFEDKLKKLGMS